MIQLRTNVAPPIQLDGVSKGEAGWILKLLQPAIEGNVPVLGQVKYAPYGEPREGAGLAVLAAVAVLVLIGFFTLVKIVVRR